jgi:hypothetical protein
VVRSAILLLSLAAAASPLPAQTNLASGSPDAVFAGLPFQTWLTQTEQAHLHWNVRVSDVELTNYQRLSTRIEIEIQGSDLAKRRGDGQFLMLTEFTGQRGDVWQYHASLNLASVPRQIKGADAFYGQSFFLLPGDYRIAVAVYDSATGEHSVVKRRLHVSPLRNDPLPEAWNGLPAVEAIADEAPPNNWYLPFSGRLRLAVEPQHPVEVDLVVNLTPSERLSGSSGALDRNLSFLLPIFKVISQVDWRNTEFNVSLVDLAHHRVAFQQDHVRRIEWRRARRSLEEINPGIVDVRSLAQRAHNAEFFLTEIGRRIREPRDSQPRVVIVLSGPVEFQSGQELNPIDLAPRPDFKVYYLRYQEPPPAVVLGRPIGRQGWAQTKRLPQRQAFRPELDQLEPLLKPVDPRLYDLTSPEQVRRALAGMMADIAKM